MFRFYFTDIDGSNMFELDYVIKVTGLGLAPPELSQIDRGWRVDGSAVTNVRSSPRPFTIQFDIHNPKSDKQMRDLGRYFAGNKPKTFWCQNDSEVPKCLTPVYLYSAVDFDVTENPLKQMIMPFFAPDPWFKINVPYSSVIYEEAALEFDFEIPEDGIEFSVSSSNAVKTNNGDKIGDTIIRFTGGANQPYIENLTTGERLVVNRNVAVTDILEINSATGRVDIIDENGVRHNAFNYIGDGGDFIHLAVGENVLKFGAELGSAGQMEVSAIEYYASI